MRDASGISLRSARPDSRRRRRARGGRGSLGDRPVAVEPADQRRTVLGVAADHGPVLVGEHSAFRMRSGRANLPMSCSRPAVCTTSCRPRCSRPPSPARARSARRRRRGGRSCGRAGRASRRAWSAPPAAGRRGGASGPPAARRDPRSAAARREVRKISKTGTAAKSIRQADAHVGEGTRIVAIIPAASSPGSSGRNSSAQEPPHERPSLDLDVDREQAEVLRGEPPGAPRTPSITPNVTPCRTRSGCG